jgi:hypothetical protein
VRDCLELKDWRQQQPGQQQHRRQQRGRQGAKRRRLWHTKRWCVRQSTCKCKRHRVTPISIPPRHSTATLKTTQRFPAYSHGNVRRDFDEQEHVVVDRRRIEFGASVSNCGNNKSCTYRASREQAGPQAICLVTIPAKTA